MLSPQQLGIIPNAPYKSSAVVLQLSCSNSSQCTVLTLLEVLDVLGGEGDPDAVHVRLLLAEALALDVSRHASLGESRINWPDEGQKV